MRVKRVDDKELTNTVLELRALTKQRAEVMELLTQINTTISEKKVAIEAVLGERLRF